MQLRADILGQTPVQVGGREHLRELLNRASGGVVFTTIHKFMPEMGEAMPELSGRQKSVVIADEAHRSQYGSGGKVDEKTGEMAYLLRKQPARALPNALFIGLACGLGGKAKRLLVARAVFSVPPSLPLFF